MTAYPRKLTLLERAAARVLVKLMSRVLGEKSEQDHAVAEEHIRSMGLRGFYQYMRSVTKFVQLMEPVFGEVNTQTLISLASLMSGCGYCGYGHALAGALLQFRSNGELHPIHPHAIAPLFDLEDHEVMERLDHLLADPSYEELRHHTSQMYKLFTGALEPVTPEDELLKGIVDFWRWTLECTIVEGVQMKAESATSPHPVGGDKQLVKRYREARAAELASSAKRLSGD